MNRRQKVSGKGTIIFEAEDLEELDELSLTSVIAEIPDKSEVDMPSEDEKETQANSDDIETEHGNETINALLDDLDAKE